MVSKTLIAVLVSVVPLPVGFPWNQSASLFFPLATLRHLVTEELHRLNGALSRCLVAQLNATCTRRNPDIQYSEVDVQVSASILRITIYIQFAISINIHQYPSISINIHQYPSISINIHQYCQTGRRNKANKWTPFNTMHNLWLLQHCWHLVPHQQFDLHPQCYHLAHVDSKHSHLWSICNWASKLLLETFDIASSLGRSVAGVAGDLAGQLRKWAVSKIKGSKSGTESHSRVCYRFRQFALSLYRVLWHAIHLLQVLQCM